jgi:hypothetical protein
VVRLHVAAAPGEFDRVELGTSVGPVPDVEHVLVTAGTGVPTSWLILSYCVPTTRGGGNLD